MLKVLLITGFCLVCSLASVFGSRRNSNITTTTSKPELPLLDRFHQNDYKLTYEWAETVRMNKDYLAEYKAIVFKYNRTITAVNMTVNVDMGYDLEAITQTYKFASNEYRVFPMRFEVNICESIAKDVLGLNKLSEAGNFSCPLLKGKRYTAFNWVPLGSNFPPLIPNGKYMIELQYLYHSQEVLVTRSYGSISRPMIGFED